MTEGTNQPCGASAPDGLKHECIISCLASDLANIVTMQSKTTLAISEALGKISVYTENMNKSVRNLESIYDRLIMAMVIIIIFCASTIGFMIYAQC